VKVNIGVSVSSFIVCWREGPKVTDEGLGGYLSFINRFPANKSLLEKLFSSFIF
jgi:hypothetical protein